MVNSTPPVLHIVGRKGAGKTRLAAAIIAALKSKGYRVAAVRHSPHDHPVDRPGADTDRFQKAGAAGAALVTSHAAALFIASSEWQEKLSCLARTFHDCHLIVIEGGMHQGRDKLEVVPPGERPLCAGDVFLQAVVGSDDGGTSLPFFVPDAIEAICTFIEARYLRPALSAAILAGGRSSRLGRDKALLPIGGATIIERVLAMVSSFAEHVRIITNDPAKYEHLGREASPDIRPGCGPLSGIHAALSMSSGEYVLVVSCDIPLISHGHIEQLCSAYPGSDIVIFKHSRFEPLCAIYRRTCLAALEELIDHGEYRIIDLFPSLSVKVIRTDDEAAFRSINTEEDYQYIIKKAGQSAVCRQAGF